LLPNETHTVAIRPTARTTRTEIGHIEVADGRIWLKQSGVKHFTGDLPEAEQKLVYSTQGVPVAVCAQYMNAASVPMSATLEGAHFYGGAANVGGGAKRTREPWFFLSRPVCIGASAFAPPIGARIAQRA
jgi:hypothetical protein